jgi:serine/threonine protein phosphatase PrpC
MSATKIVSTRSIAPIDMIKAYGVTDIGCVRENNEDRILVDEPQGLYIVADGMGGHTHGELAAELAISTIRHYVESSGDHLDVTWPFGYNFNLSVDANRMITAVQLANRQVWRQAELAPQFAGMGSTVAAVLASGRTITIGNVGDSRVYLWLDGLMRQLSIDDTWVRAISGRGVGQLDVFTHPLRNFLTQSVGSKDVIEVHTCEMELVDSDLVMLTSDGIHGFVSEEEIASIFCLDKSLEEMIATLVGRAKAAGGADNISAILLSFCEEYREEKTEDS